MATGTSGVRWCEGSANVTAFAGNIQVRAIQHETRAEVIEGLLRSGIAGCEQAAENRSDNYQAPHPHDKMRGGSDFRLCANHCNDLTSLKVSAE
jgi:hypothetical protein